VNKINRLKKLRLDRGISQEKCANETGISLSSIKRYERDGIIGNAYNLKRLAEFYSVDMDYIYDPNEYVEK
jgi:transcriptional regulator with XRE-family HTH domain